MSGATSMPSTRQMTSSETRDPLRMDDVPASGHVLAMKDHENPQNLPIYSKIYVSSAAFALTFVVLVWLFLAS